MKGFSAGKSFRYSVGTFTLDIAINRFMQSPAEKILKT